MSDPYRIILSKRVATELERIFRRVAKDSPQNAPGLVKKLLDAIEGLKAFPHRTVVEGQRPGVRRPVRSLPVNPYSTVTVSPTRTRGGAAAAGICL